MRFGTPRVHFRLTDSTNQRLRELAVRGAPDGCVVSADEQSAGRGRQGRTWSAPPRQTLLCSVLVREPPRLLSLAAGVATAEVAGVEAMIKWPNDVLIGGRKVAGILVEGRSQEAWAAVGIGLNVAIAPSDFPPELRATAGTLGLAARDIEPTLERLLLALERWVESEPEDVLAALGSRDALYGQPVSWVAGKGTAAGVDADGRLVVLSGRTRVVIDAGEVHLQTPVARTER